jgi:hypothetical protein
LKDCYPYCSCSCSCSCSLSYIIHNIIMAHNIHSPEEVFNLLRWSIISEYCTFQESLSLRLVCRSWSSSLGEALSFAMCSNFLSNYLRQENMFVVALDLEEWKGPLATTRENVTKLLKKSASTTTAFENLLRVMKIMQQFPEQVAVAFSPSYGRHCIPIDWDAGKRNSVLKYHAPCQRESCPSCQLPIPNKDKGSSANTSESESEIDNHLELRNSVGPLDLTCYVPKCIPNLPSDLCCPVCRTTNERTLVLSDCSYRSTSVASSQDRVSLTWAPCREQDHFESNTRSADVENPNNDKATSRREKEEQPSPKRQKSDSAAIVRQDRTFPPRYDDMAVPTRNEPLLSKPDSRHALSMHCSKCHSFAIISPAAPCWNNEYCCHERGRHLEDGTILGGVFNRATCCIDECFLPVPCHYCSHSNFHDSYVGEDGESQRLLRRAAACDACCKTYCAEHSWIATACHHW